jgi:hypothetical protein
VWETTESWIYIIAAAVGALCFCYALWAIRVKIDRTRVLKYHLPWKESGKKCTACDVFFLARFKVPFAVETERGW